MIKTGKIITSVYLIFILLSAPCMARSSSDPFFQTLYAKIGYISSYNYSYAPEIYDVYYASSLLYGIGYSFCFTPYAALVLEASKANFSSPDASWTLTPITAGLKIGYPMSEYGSAFYYYSLGIGYFLTDLEHEGINLTSVGFNMATGLEIPFGLDGSIFIETGYGIGENSKAEFAMDNITVTLGYRMTTL